MPPGFDTEAYINRVLRPLGRGGSRQLPHVVVRYGLDQLPADATDQDLLRQVHQTVDLWHRQEEGGPPVSPKLADAAWMKTENYGTKPATAIRGGGAVVSVTGRAPATRAKPVQSVPPRRRVMRSGRRRPRSPAGGLPPGRQAGCHGYPARTVPAGEPDRQVLRRPFGSAVASVASGAG